MAIGESGVFNRTGQKGVLPILEQVLEIRSNWSREGDPGFESPTARVELKTRQSDPSTQSKGVKQASGSCVTEERFRGQQQHSQGHPALLPLDPTKWQGPINSCQGDIVRGTMLLRNSVEDSGEPWKAHLHSGQE